MDCQKLILYGILLLVGVYVLKDVCGIKLPFVEGFEGEGVPEQPVPSSLVASPSVAQPSQLQAVSTAPAVVPPEMITQGQPSPQITQPSLGPPGNGPVNSEGPAIQQVFPSEPQGDEVNQPVQGIQTVPSSCYPQNTLKPADLLPEGEASAIQNFSESVPNAGEGILKGVNFLDAGFHIGVNTVGQSLRNANLNLRAEPPNPRMQVSPWMNTTIDGDLMRKPLSDDSACNKAPPGAAPVGVSAQ
jgi:hypothetical protein